MSSDSATGTLNGKQAVDARGCRDWEAIQSLALPMDWLDDVCSRLASFRACCSKLRLTKQSEQIELAFVMAAQLLEPPAGDGGSPKQRIWIEAKADLRLPMRVRVSSDDFLDFQCNSS